MDCRNGEIHTFDGDEAKKLINNHMVHEGRKLAPLSEKQHNKLLPMGSDRRKGYMRNQPCPCESGKKFKKCCWGKYSS